MQPDATILSILDRYHNNEPVTIEEKAVLHKWLIKSLRARNSGAAAPPPVSRNITAIRKKIALWQYVFIVLMLLAVAFTLYLFSVKTGKCSIKQPHGDLHSNYQEVRKPG